MQPDDDRTKKQKKTLVKYGKYGKKKKEKKIQTRKVSQMLASFFMVFFALLFYCPKSQESGENLKLSFPARLQYRKYTGDTRSDRADPVYILPLY